MKQEPTITECVFRTVINMSECKRKLSLYEENEPEYRLAEGMINDYRMMLDWYLQQLLK